MAKKAKRKVSSDARANTSAVVEPEIDDVAGQTGPAGQTGSGVENGPIAPVVPGAPRVFSRRQAPVAEFKPDYGYIVRDLKRIGTMAGGFFVVLIILSFILK